MTVDEAVILHVQRFLLDEGFVNQKEARRIAREAAEAIKDEFSQSITDMSIEVDKIRKRTDRLWDASLKAPDMPSRWSKFWRKVFFWRSDDDLS